VNPPGSETPRPTRNQRAAGLAAVAGAILWPVGLVAFANASLSACLTGTDCLLSGSIIVPLALATALLAIGVSGLELRAPGEFELLDLVGDLSVATAAALFLVAALIGSFGLVGPGFLLILIGSVIFGARGWNGRRRSRWGSILVALGAGTEVVFLLLATTVGTATVGGFESAALMGLLIYSVGWAWLGFHLLLGRQLEPLPYRER
jgi:hypothetical protein